MYIKILLKISSKMDNSWCMMSSAISQLPVQKDNSIIIKSVVNDQAPATC